MSVEECSLLLNVKACFSFDLKVRDPYSQCNSERFYGW